MAWKPASLAFPGGTQAARLLYGRRVRTLRALELASFEVNGFPEQVPLRMGEEGFVGHVPAQAMDHIVLAFPVTGIAPATIEQLSRRPFRSILVNWPTFREQFQIDI